jgi:hypothetical protein
MKHVFYVFNAYLSLTYLYAIVANRTMRASGGTVELTRVAPFHSNSYSADFNAFVKWSSEIIFWSFSGLEAKDRPVWHGVSKGVVGRPQAARPADNHPWVAARRA